MNKKGQFFELDLILAFIILVVGFAFIQIFLLGSTETSQSDALARDMFTLLDEQPVSAFDQNVQDTLLALTAHPEEVDPTNTVLRQLLIFEILGDDAAADYLSEVFFEQNLPDGYNVDLNVITPTVDYDLIDSPEPSDDARQIVQTRGLMSGFSVDFDFFEGFDSDLLLGKDKNTLSAIASFGGFTGQGDIETILQIPYDDETEFNPHDFFIELDLPADANLFINAELCDVPLTAPLQNKDISLVRFDLTSCIDDLEPGDNLLRIEFEGGTSVAQQYVGGGIIHVNYDSQTKPDSSEQIQFIPRVEGYANLYDGIYLPTSFSSGDELRLQLSFTLEESENDLQPDYYFTFGDDELFSYSEPDDYDVDITLDYDDIGEFAGQTVPWRFGPEAFSGSVDSSGSADIIFSLDRSGSMRSSSLVPVPNQQQCRYRYSFNDTGSADVSCPVQNQATCNVGFTGCDAESNFTYTNLNCGEHSISRTNYQYSAGNCSYTVEVQATGCSQFASYNDMPLGEAASTCNSGSGLNADGNYFNYEDRVNTMVWPTTSILRAAPPATLYDFRNHQSNAVIYTRWELATVTSQDFISNLFTQISDVDIGLSFWSTTIDATYPLVDASGESDLFANYASDPQTGSTCISCGLLEPASRLMDSEDSVKAIVLLSDGEARSYGSSATYGLNSHAFCDDQSFFQEYRANTLTEEEARILLSRWSVELGLNDFNLTTITVDNGVYLESLNLDVDYDDDLIWNAFTAQEKDALRQFATYLGGHGGQAICNAHYVHTVLEIDLYALAMQLSGEKGINQMKLIASMDSPDNFFAADTEEDLESAFDSITQSIDASLEFETQVFVVEDLPGTSISSGKLQLNDQNPAKISYDLNKLLVPLEQELSVQEIDGGESCEATLDIPGFFTPYDAQLFVYSGDAWLKELSANSVELYDITAYDSGSSYDDVGDPFAVYIPEHAFDSSTTFEFSIGTDASASKNTCPDSVQIFYTAGIQTAYNLEGVFTDEPQGCNWEVDIFTGIGVETFEATLPESYTGTDNCYYTESIHEVNQSLTNVQDPFQQIIFNFFRQIDVIQDGTVDIDLLSEGLTLSEGITSNIPFLFGPAIVEVTLWN